MRKLTTARPRISAVAVLLCAAFLLLPTVLAAQTAGTAFPRSADFSAIDRYVRSMPKLASSAQVAASLGRAATSEWEKARAIYDWVCYNIAYDTDSYFSGSEGGASTASAASAASAFESGKSVCQGYSDLTLELARLLGIEAIAVSGFSKGYEFSKGIPITGANHAWNAFRIDGAWYLMDSTWGAGSIDESREFRKDLSYAWFAMDPSLFIYTHFPEEPAGFTLLGEKLTLRDFEKLTHVEPYVFNALYDLGLTPEFQKALVRETGSSLNDSYWRIEILAEEGFADSEILAAIQHPGTEEYFLRTLELKKFDFANSDILSYFVSGKAPRAFTLDIGVTVVNAPKSPELKIGSTYEFEFRSDEAVDAAVICAKKFTILEKRGGSFYGNVVITDGPVRIAFRKDASSPSYKIAFEYDAVR